VFVVIVLGFREMKRVRFVRFVVFAEDCSVGRAKMAHLVKLADGDLTKLSGIGLTHGVSSITSIVILSRVA
jgi:hypothetical protein